MKPLTPLQLAAEAYDKAKARLQQSAPIERPSTPRTDRMGSTSGPFLMGFRPYGTLGAAPPSLVGLTASAAQFSWRYDH
jgi:hypothetical protein